MAEGRIAARRASLPPPPMPFTNRRVVTPMLRRRCCHQREPFTPVKAPGRHRAATGAAARSEQQHKAEAHGGSPSFRPPIQRLRGKERARSPGGRDFPSRREQQRHIHRRRPAQHPPAPVQQASRRSSPLSSSQVPQQRRASAPERPSAQEDPPGIRAANGAVRAAARLRDGHTERWFQNGTAGKKAAAQRPPRLFFRMRKCSAQRALYMPMEQRMVYIEEEQRR